MGLITCIMYARACVLRLYCSKSFILNDTCKYKNYSGAACTTLRTY